MIKINQSRKSLICQLNQSVNNDSYDSKVWGGGRRWRGERPETARVIGSSLRRYAIDKPLYIPKQL